MLNWFKNAYSNKFKFFVTLAVLVTLSLGAVVIAQKIPKKETVEVLEPLPKGDWTIVYHPYTGEDFLKYPVIVHSVLSTKRLEAGRIEIQNISNKTVKGVRVKWNVYQDEDRSKILKTGQTNLLSLKDDLPSGKIGFIKKRFVSYTDFYKDFLVKGELNKNLDIDILVDEVIYADGLSWKMEDGTPADINQELLVKFSNPNLVGDCAKQKCVPRASGPVIGATVYSCGTSEFNERCSTDGDFACKNESCVRPGGGGWNPNAVNQEYEIIVE
jgi:hypothetical protein